jgi:hypothetical protein
MRIFRHLIRGVRQFCIILRNGLDLLARQLAERVHACGISKQIAVIECALWRFFAVVVFVFLHDCGFILKIAAIGILIGLCCAASPSPSIWRVAMRSTMGMPMAAVVILDIQYFLAPYFDNLCYFILKFS